jgi:hypothetical protein
VGVRAGLATSYLAFPSTHDPDLLSCTEPQL